MKKKLTLALALAVAALATAGQMKNPSNPQTLNGKKLPPKPNVYPVPDCPPCAHR
jgi:hypothetical protein